MIQEKITLTLPRYRPSHAPARAEGYRRERLAPWQLRRAKTLIRDNILKRWSLEELAAEAGTSVSHFCRAFRNSEGIPPYRYLIGLRVEHAKKMPTASPMPLSAIAEDVGCETVGQFPAFSSEKRVRAHQHIAASSNGE